MTSVQILSATNFATWQRSKADEARKIAERTINSEHFQKAVLNATFLDVRLERADDSVVTNLTNRQILDVILTGTEQGQGSDNVVGLKLQLYYQLFGSAIGHTKGGIIHTRSKFFNNADPVEIAGHWIHEWTHTAGFMHDFHRTSRREHSVPYLVGELLVESAVALGLVPSESAANQ